MNRRKVMSLVLAGVVLTVSAITIAAGPGRDGPKHRSQGAEMGIERIMDRIPELSSEQEQQIYAIIDPVRSEMRSARREKRELHREIRELNSTGAEETAVNAKIDEFSKKQAEIMKKQAAQRRQILQVLTTEQKEVLEERPPRRPRKGDKR